MSVYILRNGEKHGPYEEPVVADWLTNGTCSPQDLAWRDGMGDWQPLSAISLLPTKKKTSVQMQSEDVKPRTEMNPEELNQAWSKAAEQMMEALSPEAEAHLSDLLFGGERIIFKVRSSPDGERSQLVLTDQRLFIFSKGLFGGQQQDSSKGLLGTLMAIGQFSARVYPLSKITGFEFKPRKAVTVGHFQVLTDMTLENDNESKFLLDTHLGYFKGVLVYRKILELQGNDGT